MQQVTIQEKSWHYKFSKWTYGNYYKPKTFCPYFWRLVLAFVIWPFILIGKAIAKCIENAPEWSISDETSQHIQRGVGATFREIASLLRVLHHCKAIQECSPEEQQQAIALQRKPTNEEIVAKYEGMPDL